MGNNNTSGNITNGKNREVEIEIFNRFSRIAKDKFSSLAISSNNNNNNSNHNLKRLDELYQRPEFDAERSVLEELNNLGLRGGIFCGLACFAVLRMGPGMISRMVVQRSRGPFQQQHKSPFQSGGGYKFDAINTAEEELLRRQQKPPGMFFRLLRLTVDAFVSLSVGAYASVYFTDTEQMMKRFAEVPLLPGRSLLSEELCDEFIKEFRKFDRRVWDGDDENEGRGGGDTVVDFRSTIQTFVTNCQRRHIYEEELKKEMGQQGGAGGMMSDFSDNGFQKDSTPVIIPSPGVPSDIFVSLDDLLGGEEDPNDKLSDMNGMDDFDTYFDDEKDDEREQ